jgi:hypothetical protein
MPFLTCYSTIYLKPSAWILSCFSPRVGAWLTIWSIFPNFQLVSLVFFTMFQIQLGLPHSSIASIFQCVCTHPIDLMDIHLLHCAHGNEHIGTHDVICNTFVTIAWDVAFPHWVRTITCVFFKHIQLFLLKSRHYAHQRWHLHLSQHCPYQPNTNRFTSLILRHPRICCFWCRSSQRMQLSLLTPRWSIPPLNNGNIWMST